VTRKILSFWICSLVHRYPPFWGMYYPEAGCSLFLRNVDNDVPENNILLQNLGRCILKLAVYSSEIMVRTYHTIRCHDAEIRNMNVDEPWRLRQNVPPERGSPPTRCYITQQTPLCVPCI
jgi:hypothetical protein